MKTKNKKDLEKYWAEQARKVSKASTRKSPQKKAAPEGASPSPTPILY
jgi:hypothetical protein